jgi:hypothetical protein
LGGYEGLHPGATFDAQVTRIIARARLVKW